jgi:hypothetical protein
VRATSLRQPVERRGAITAGVCRRGFHHPSLYLNPDNQEG